MKSERKRSGVQFGIRILQGALIGIGAILPGISGGVLCVIFGIYTIIINFLANPFRDLKNKLSVLIPVGIGGVVGFMGGSYVLSYVLEKYPAPSLCLFIGLIGGMLPSLFKEAGEQGRNKASYVSMVVSMIIVFALLIGLKLFSVTIEPSFGWYIFCGACLALSVIAPGLSFSTLLMPLGLYEPFVSGIGNIDFSILIPGGIGGLATVILLSRAINSLFTKHHSVAFHAIIGIVIAATIMIIPASSFVASVPSCLCNILFVGIGVVAALMIDKVNQKYKISEE